MIKIENALTPEELALVHADLTATNGWFNLNKEWHQRLIIGVDGKVDRSEPGMIPAGIIRNAIVNRYPQFRHDNMRIVYHRFAHRGGISVHDDTGSTFAATLYLNQEWDVNWGGLLLWKEKGGAEWKVVVPTYNLLVLNLDGDDHFVTPVTSAAPQHRQTLQVFGMIKY